MGEGLFWEQEQEIQSLVVTTRRTRVRTTLWCRARFFRVITTAVLVLRGYSISLGEPEALRLEEPSLGQHLIALTQQEQAIAEPLVEAWF